MIKQLQLLASPKIRSLLQTPWLLVTILVLSGLILRGYNWGAYPFGFDQVQILENADLIRQGDLALIGPRTGPAQMFTGPLIYYWTAAWRMITDSPFSLVLTSLSLSFITGISLYWLSRRAASISTSMTILLIWAFAPFFIASDRVTWNPNLTLLASSLVFFPMMRLIGSSESGLKKNWPDYALMSLGAFLGYQAHFSGLLLPGLAIVCVALLNRRKVGLATVAVIVGLAASLLPTILFDLRNNWMNLNGLLLLGQQDATVLLIDRVKDIWGSFLLVSKNLGWLGFWDTNVLLPLIAGVSLIAAQIWQIFNTKNRQQQKTLFLPLLWLGMIMVIFAVYKRDKPEYYFLIQIPAALLLLEQVLFSKLRATSLHYIAVAALVIYGVSYTVIKYPLGNGTNLHNQVAVSNYLHYFHIGTPVSAIIYDMKPVDAIGLKYLTKDIQVQSGGPEAHLVYPYPKDALASFDSHDMSVWIDTRTTADFHYVTQPRYLMGTPKNLSLLIQPYPEVGDLDADRYQLLIDGQQRYKFYVVEDSRHKDTYFPMLRDALPQIDKQYQWEFYSTDGYTGWVNKGNHHLFLLPTTASSNAELAPLLDSFQIKD